MAIGPEKLLKGAQVELVATLILGGQRFPAGKWTIEYTALEQGAEVSRPELAAALRYSADLVTEEQP